MATSKADQYVEGIGRRKTATARVRLYEKKGDIVVNDLSYKKYFPTKEMQHIVEDAMRVLEVAGLSVSAHVNGGGIHAQAEAFRHGLSRAFLKKTPDIRTTLKHAGYLKRDPRVKERKKFGLKKARKSPQWSKR